MVNHDAFKVSSEMTRKGRVVVRVECGMFGEEGCRTTGRLACAALIPVQDIGEDAQVEELQQNMNCTLPLVAAGLELATN